MIQQGYTCTSVRCQTNFSVSVLSHVRLAADANVRTLQQFSYMYASIVTSQTSFSSSVLPDVTQVVDAHDNRVPVCSIVMCQTILSRSMLSPPSSSPLSGDRLSAATHSST